MSTVGRPKSLAALDFHVRLINLIKVRKSMRHMLLQAGLRVAQSLWSRPVALAYQYSKSAAARRHLEHRFYHCEGLDDVLLAQAFLSLGVFEVEAVDGGGDVLDRVGRGIWCGRGKPRGRYHEVALMLGVEVSDALRDL